MNKKKPEEKKKKKFSFSINNKLLQIFDDYIEDEDISSRSKYIEKLIRDDMKKRGLNIDQNF